MSRHTPQSAAAYSRKVEERIKNKEVDQLKLKVQGLYGTINGLRQDINNLEKKLDETECKLQDAEEREEELLKKLEGKVEVKSVPVERDGGYCRMVPGWGATL